SSRASIAPGRVRITGGATTLLYPGGASPIALTFSSKGSHTLKLGKVRVKVKKVTAPNATAQHPCTKADFTVIQMKAKLRLPQGKRTLASLGVPTQAWPQLVMRNLPVNQDGCQGARLSLSFKAKPLR
ncbi:MAG TPA: hypothetical protein PL137_08990, partial [Nocardioides sp.]|nr:hypothetical protein [Nocardioides sp.]